MYHVVIAAQRRREKSRSYLTDIHRGSFVPQRRRGFLNSHRRRGVCNLIGTCQSKE